LITVTIAAQLKKGETESVAQPPPQGAFFSNAKRLGEQQTLTLAS
jgi:hypothetical protein